MPIARIQMPDGRIARIEVPQGTTPEEAQRVAMSLVPLQSAQADFERQVANLPAEAQRIGREKFNSDPRIRSLMAASQFQKPAPKAAPRQKGTGVAAIDGTTNWINNALIGGVEGIYNLGSAISDPIASLFATPEQMQAARDQRKNAFSGARNQLTTADNTVARTTGQIGATLPFAAAKAPQLLGRAAPVATRALQGAVGGAAVRDPGDGAGTSTAIGAVTNVAFPPALSWLANSRYGRPIIEGVTSVAAPVVNRAGALLDDASEAVLSRVNPRIGRAYTPPAAPAPAVIPPRLPAPTPPAATLSRAERVRAERLRRSGVTEPTTAMVTRNPSAWTFEQEAAKRAGELGAPLQQAITTADQQLGNRARELVGQQGGTIGREATGQRVIDAVQARNEALNAEVGALYTQAREKFGDVRVTDLRNLRDLQNHPEWADNAVFDDMLAALNKRLAKYADADGGATGLTVSQAEEVRKFINNLGADSNQTFAIRRVLKNALDSDVLDNVGGQPFAEARAAAAARFDEFNNTLPGRLVNERIPPEQVANRVMGQGVSLGDLRDLRNTLQQAPGGEDALRALPSQMVEDTLRPALGDEYGVAGASVYNNFMKNQDRLRELLDPSAYKDIRRFALAARDARATVPNSNVNHSNTASAYANFFAPATQPERSPLGALVGEYGPRAGGAAVGGLLGLIGGPSGAAVGAPAGYIATQALQEMGQRRTANAIAQRMAQQVEAARNPQLAAELASVNQWQAQQDALIRAERDRLTASLSNPALGGASAGLFGQRRQ